MKLLGKFHADYQVRDEVKAYLLDYVEKQAVKRVFKREDVSGLADAKDCIEGAFKALDRLYEVKPVRNQKSTR